MIKEKSKMKLGFAVGVFTTMILSSVYVFAVTLVKPHTFSSGQTISATEMNTNFDSIYTHINRPSFIARLSSDQTPGASDEVLVVDNVVEDSSSSWNNSTYTFTVPANASGLYAIGAYTQCITGCSGATSETVGVEINSSSVIDVNLFAVNDSADSRAVVTFKYIELAGGDQLRFLTSYGGGGSENHKASTSLFVIRKM